MKYAIVGDEDAVMGFGIVGVSGRVATDAAEARHAFESLREDRDVGVILITERLAEMIRPLVDPHLMSASFPLIVEVPDRKGPLQSGKGIRDMVNTTIGIKL